MGGQICRGALVGMLYSCNDVSTAFVPSQSILGVRSMEMTTRRRLQASCSRNKLGGDAMCACWRSPTGLRMIRTDTQAGVEGSESSPSSVPIPVTGSPPTAVPGTSPSTQFASIDSGEVGSYLLGELNLCLRPQDTVLSGPSITKALNAASNKMIKNLLILNSPEDDVPAVRDAELMESAFDAEYSGQSDYPAAKAYLSCVCQLAKEGCPSHETLEGLTEEFGMAFRRVAGVLSDFGCTLTPGKMARIRPADQDICLSIMDYALPDQDMTRTRALNTLGNRVLRTVCVGSDEDLQGLAREMNSKREKFMDKWIGGAWQTSEENSFYDALVNLVRNGLTDDPPVMHGAYLNSYERLMGIVVQEVGTRSTPASEMVLKSFLAWEREIRKELTEPAWQSNPADLVGSWALETRGSDVLTDLPVRGSEMEDLGLNDLVVTFLKDGTVQVPPEAGMGLKWRVDPGPTHLDTVYFEMIPANIKIQGVTESDGGGGSSLSYTGYVDRGARIEARFSKRFLKMTGRMTSIVRGQERPSTRFSMRLVERGEGKSQS